ncbi:MAG: hypothetical protein AB8E15_06880 [Bdellovibrionales bacterium]
MAIKNLYKEIIQQIASEPMTLIILDLDSTIYDLTERQLKIFREFSEVERFLNQFPKECEALSQLDEDHMTFYPVDCIKNYGVKEIDSDFEDVFYPYWAERFFSNDYLKYDLVEDMAVDFVHDLFERGAYIRYLTGRDVARMGEGTHDTLKKHDFFPSGDPCEKVSLVLKPEKSMNDAEFKRDYIQSCYDEGFKKIIFIDNEPKNLVLAETFGEKMHIVHFDTYHMGDTEVPESATVIDSFQFK